MPIVVSDILPEGAAAAEEVAPQEEEATPEAAPAPAPKKRGRPAGSKNRPKPPSEVASEVVSEVASEEVSEEGEAASAGGALRSTSPPKAKAKAKAKATATAPTESVRSASGAPRSAVKRAAPKRAPPPVYESESEEEAPLSPMSQRRAQWAAYRQAQVDAHQARTTHYSKALDRMLAF